MSIHPPTPQETPKGAGVFVLVPAYQEASVIEPTVRSLLALGYSVIIIDDGSTDGTWDVVAALPVHIVRHCVNLGQGAALQTGLDLALRLRADLVVFFDADGQHRAEDLPSLIEPIQRGEADVVLGSRFLRRADALAIPRTRRVVLRVAVIVNWVMAGVRLSDAHNGVKAFSRHAITQIRIEENGFAHATELLQQIRRLGLRALERPVHVRYSDYSTKKGQSVWGGVGTLVDLVVRRLLS